MATETGATHRVARTIIVEHGPSAIPWLQQAMDNPNHAHSAEECRWFIENASTVADARLRVHEGKPAPVLPLRSWLKESLAKRRFLHAEGLFHSLAQVNTEQALDVLVWTLDYEGDPQGILQHLPETSFTYFGKALLTEVYRAFEGLGRKSGKKSQY